MVWNLRYMILEDFAVRSTCTCRGVGLGIDICYGGGDEHRSRTFQKAHNHVRHESLQTRE